MRTAAEAPNYQIRDLATRHGLTFNNRYGPVSHYRMDFAYNIRNMNYSGLNYSGLFAQCAVTHDQGTAM
jgi:hypothetical protein